LIAGTKDTAAGDKLITGGVGNLESGAVANIKGSILSVDGVLYVSAPDNAWAIDARDGHLIWHYWDPA
jgi:alcohol dehydrogenase (cytochrome c)